MIHWIIVSLVPWFDDWSIDSMIPWFISSMVYWLVESLIHWFMGSLLLWFVGSLNSNHWIHCFIESMIHGFTDSLFHWFIQSAVCGFFYVIPLAFQQLFAYSLMHLTSCFMFLLETSTPAPGTTWQWCFCDGHFLPSPRSSWTMTIPVTSLCTSSLTMTMAVAERDGS